MKIFEILTSTLKIVWNHKLLWWWQITPSISVIFIFPLFFIYLPIIKEIFEESELKTPIAPWITISSNFFIFLFVLSYLTLNFLVQTATIRSLVSINKGDSIISFKENFSKSLTYFWRLLGLYFIWVGVVSLINFPLTLIIRIVYKNIQLIPENLLVFFNLLILPIILISLIIMELTQSVIIVDNVNLKKSILHAWEIFKNNKLNSILLLVILYFGLAIPFLLLMFPLPLFLVITILYLTRLPDLNIIVFIVFFVLAPLIVVVITFWYRAFLSFFHCSWAIAYLKIKQSSEVKLMEQNEL
jgi:hypothetical protein